MRLDCPGSKERHYRRVTKATPDFSPQGAGGQEHGERSAKRERHLYRGAPLRRVYTCCGGAKPLVSSWVKQRLTFVERVEGAVA
jgi:hypothetical protein